MLAGVEPRSSLRGSLSRPRHLFDPREAGSKGSRDGVLWPTRSSTSSSGALSVRWAMGSGGQIAGSDGAWRYRHWDQRRAAGSSASADSASAHARQSSPRLACSSSGRPHAALLKRRERSSRFTPSPGLAAVGSRPSVRDPAATASASVLRHSRTAIRPIE